MSMFKGFALVFFIYLAAGNCVQDTDCNTGSEDGLCCGVQYCVDSLGALTTTESTCVEASNSGSLPITDSDSNTCSYYCYSTDVACGQDSDCTAVLGENYVCGVEWKWSNGHIKGAYCFNADMEG